MFETAQEVDQGKYYRSAKIETWLIAMPLLFQWHSQILGGMSLLFFGMPLQLYCLMAFTNSMSPMFNCNVALLTGIYQCATLDLMCSCCVPLLNDLSLINIIPPNNWELVSSMNVWLLICWCSKIDVIWIHQHNASITDSFWEKTKV